MALAAKTFEPNGPYLALLKKNLDPCNMLAYACPLTKPPIKQKRITLVTGESGIGKDYCTNVWVSIFTEYANKHYKACKASISDTAKRESRVATGVDLDTLLLDYPCKEQHKPALTAFFKEQMPRLHEKHFLHVVSDVAGMDVLEITGMRDEVSLCLLTLHMQLLRLFSLPLASD